MAITVAIMIPVAIVIPIAVPVPVAVAVSIPVVIVLEAAAVTVPVALEELLPIVMGRNPARPSVGRPGPVSFMPPVMAAYRIPITIHPKIIRTRRRGPHSNDAGRGRRTNAYSKRHLSGEHRSTRQKQYGKQFFHIH